MGSRNPKSKGRTGETKVKNRGPKVMKPVVFDFNKAKQLFEEYQKNGFKQASFNQVLEMTPEPKSLIKFKRVIGELQKTKS